NAQTPVMDALWRLPIAGVATANLDRIPETSFARVSPGEPPPRVTVGTGAARNPRILHRSDLKFIIKLHGDIDSRDSWVFTDAERRSLHNSSHYQSFLDELYKSFLVIFVGISAADYSVGGALRALTNSGGDR